MDFPPDIPNPYRAAGPQSSFTGFDMLLRNETSSLGLTGNPERYRPGTDIPAITTRTSDFEAVVSKELSFLI
jgi:hypothetical protein